MKIFQGVGCNEETLPLPTALSDIMKFEERCEGTSFHESHEGKHLPELQ